MSTGSGLSEDSDNDSLSDELSPTDGYFHQRPGHPQDVLVPDPSQGPGGPDKAREAQDERNANTTNGTSERRQSQAATRSVTSRRRLDIETEEFQTELTPLIPSAPPAYSAATADSPHRPSRPATHTSSGSGENIGYSTMGRPDIFLPYRQPTDLGGGSSFGAPRSEEQGWKKKLQSWLPKSFGGYLVVLVALVIGVGFIADAITNIHNRHSSNPNPSVPEPGSDEQPGSGPPTCPAALHTCSARFTFASPGLFEFLELVSGVNVERGDTYRQIYTLGEIHIKPSTDHLELDLRVDVDIHYSDVGMMREIKFQPSPQSLAIYTPSHMTEISSSHPCMYIVATLYVNPAAHLEYLKLDAQSMKVIFHEGISLDTNLLQVALDSGSVSFPSGAETKMHINPRRIEIYTMSGSVSGTYPLYDLLKITTQSGSIRVAVDPQEASRSEPQPAVLELHSTSGMVSVDTPMLAAHNQSASSSTIPSRDYQTQISSSSGSLQATLIHGSRTSLTSSSGSMKAALSPQGPPSESSYLSTKTRSGSTSIAVLSSISHPGAPMRQFYGDYRYMSGSLAIRYPAEWEGSVEGQTVSGSISVRWPGLRIIRHSTVPTGPVSLSVIKGVKGHGEGTLRFEGVSGSVSLRG